MNPVLVDTSAFLPEGHPHKLNDRLNHSNDSRAISPEIHTEIIGYRRLSKSLLYEMMELEQQGITTPTELTTRYNRYVELAEIARNKSFHSQA